MLKFLAVVASVMASSQLATSASAKPQIDRSFGDAGRVTLKRVPGHPDLQWATPPTAAQVVRVVGRHVYVIAQTTRRRDNWGGPPAIVRFDRRGRLDRSFGGTGVVVLWDPATWGADYRELNEAPDGDIVLAGGYLDETNDEDGYDIEWAVVVRLNHDGTRDERFGKRGVVGSGFGPQSVLDKAGLYEIDHALLLPSGKLILGADGFPCAKLIRLTRDGGRDLSFGKRGLVRLPDADERCSKVMSHVSRQPDGRIVVIGDSTMILRYTADGRPDAGFGSGGRLGIQGVPPMWWITEAFANPDGTYTLFRDVENASERWDISKATVGPDGTLSVLSTDWFASLGLAGTSFGKPSISTFGGIIAVDNGRRVDRAILIHRATDPEPFSASNTIVFKPGPNHPADLIALGVRHIVLASMVGSYRSRLVVERYLRQ